MGSHIHTVKIIADHLYILDFLADRIEVFKVSPERLEMKTVLGPMSAVAKIPCGEISASRRYLVVPGKSNLDNGPVLCCWNTETGAVMSLSSDRPTCPYRFFRKTAIAHTKIFGLLDRLRLHCWEGETGSPVFTVDLTNSGPRENTADSWLVVNQYCAVTVHQDLLGLSVLSPQGRLLTKVLPALPPPYHLSTWEVREVTLRATEVFIRLQETRAEAQPPDTIRQGSVF